MKGLLVVLVAPSQAGKDTIAGKMADYIQTHGYDQPETVFASVYKTREPRETDPSYIHAVGKDGEVPVKKEDQICAEIFGQTATYNKSEIQALLDQGKIVFVTTCSPKLGTKLKQEYGEQCNTIFIRTATNTIYNKNRQAYMGLVEYQRKTGSKLAHGEIVPDEIIGKMQDRVREFQNLMPEYEAFMQEADNITINWWTLFMDDWNTIIKRKSEAEIGRQCSKIYQIYKYINQPHNTPWDSGLHFVASSRERSLPPFSLGPEFEAYREEKREYN